MSGFTMATEAVPVGVSVQIARYSPSVVFLGGIVVPSVLSLGGYSGERKGVMFPVEKMVGLE